MCWFLAGFVWISVLSVERSLEETADAAQKKLHTITLISIPWIGVLFVVGVPFLFASVRRGYSPLWESTPVFDFMTV